jgi:hypothetical protein
MIAHHLDFVAGLTAEELQRADMGPALKQMNRMQANESSLGATLNCANVRKERIPPLPWLPADPTILPKHLHWRVTKCVERFHGNRCDVFIRILWGTSLKPFLLAASEHPLLLSSFWGPYFCPPPRLTPNAA